MSPFDYYADLIITVFLILWAVVRASQYSQSYKDLELNGPFALVELMGHKKREASCALSDEEIWLNKQQPKLFATVFIATFSALTSIGNMYCGIALLIVLLLRYAFWLSIIHTAASWIKNGQHLFTAHNYLVHFAQLACVLIFDIGIHTGIYFIHPFNKLGLIGATFVMFMGTCLFLSAPSSKHLRS